MAHDPNKKRSLKSKFVLAAIVLLAAGFLTAMVPAVLTLATVYRATMTPIAEFTPAAPAEVELPDTNTNYLVAVFVDREYDRGPAVTVEASTLTGDEVPSQRYDGWSDMGETHIRYRLRLKPEQAGTVVLNVVPRESEDNSSEASAGDETEPSENYLGTERFAVFRDHNDVMLQSGLRAMPAWIASGAMGVLGLLSIFTAITLFAFEPDRVPEEQDFIP